MLKMCLSVNLEPQCFSLSVTHIQDCHSMIPAMEKSQVCRRRRLKKWVCVPPQSHLFQFWAVWIIYVLFSLISCSLKTLDPKWNEEFFFRVSTTSDRNRITYHYVFTCPLCFHRSVKKCHCWKTSNRITFYKNRPIQCELISF